MFPRISVMQHQNRIRNLWIYFLIPAILAIAPGPWLFSLAGIDMTIEPVIPKLVIVFGYCIGAFVAVKLLLHGFLRLFTHAAR